MPTPRPAPRRRGSVGGKAQRFEMERPAGWDIPTKRINCSLETADPVEGTRRRKLLRALATSEKGQAFCEAWLRPGKTPTWELNTILAAQTTSTGKRRTADDMIEWLLAHRSHAVSFCAAIAEHRVDQDTAEKADAAKNEEKLRVFLAWLTREQRSTSLRGALTGANIADFFIDLKQAGAQIITNPAVPKRSRGVSTQTLTRYRASFLGFATGMVKRYPGLLDLDEFRAVVPRYDVASDDDVVRIPKWTDTQQDAWFRLTYSLTVRGAAHLHDAMGLYLRWLALTGIDAGDLCGVVRASHLQRDSRSGIMHVHPGRRSKSKRKKPSKLIGPRQIPLPEFLVAETERHAAQYAREIAANDGLLFGMIAPRRTAEAHGRLIEQLGLSAATAHLLMKDLRHAACVHWLRANIAQPVVAARMGHLNLDTLRHYAGMLGVDEVSVQDEMARISDRFGAQTPPQQLPQVTPDAPELATG